MLQPEIAVVKLYNRLVRSVAGIALAVLSCRVDCPDLDESGL